MGWTGKARAHRYLIILVALLSLTLTGCSGEAPQSYQSTKGADTAAEASGASDAEDGMTVGDGMGNTYSGTSAENVSTNALGGLAPEDAIEYMKSTLDLVIVQVSTAQWKIDPGFSGALWIPHDELAGRFGEIPEGRPVLLHCGAGVVSVPAYETLLEKKPDIPELSYIAGSPHSIIDEYNEWLAAQ